MALELQQTSPDITLPLLFLVVYLILGGISIFLFIKSKNVPSESLKTGILASLIFALLGILWMLFISFGYSNDQLVKLLVYSLLTMFLITLISSITALIKIEKKSLAFWTLFLSALDITSLISIVLMSIRS